MLYNEINRKIDFISSGYKRPRCYELKLLLSLAVYKDIYIDLKWEKIKFVIKEK